MAKTKKVTIKTVEEVINPNKTSPDVDDRVLNKINDTKERLLMENNYEWQFKRTEHHWGHTHWRKIAQDVANAIN